MHGAAETPRKEPLKQTKRSQSCRYLLYANFVPRIKQTSKKPTGPGEKENNSTIRHKHHSTSHGKPWPSSPQLKLQTHVALPPLQCLPAGCVVCPTTVCFELLSRFNVASALEMSSQSTFNSVWSSQSEFSSLVLRY